MDYAATSAIRPAEVCKAMSDYMQGCGASPGRGGHRLAVDATRVAFRCRMALAKLLGIPGDPGQVAFMFNATHAINTALLGVLKEGDVVVISQYDHNAVLRPVHQLAAERNIEVRVLSGSPDGAIDYDEAAKKFDGGRLVCLNAASNVLGTLLDVKRLTKLAHDAGALVMVDAAQSAGHMHINVVEQDIDLLALTGHKGLLGPQGTGALWVKENVDVAPLIRGGTGGDSMVREMPGVYPDHLEAGTHNAPGIAGLHAGIDWIKSQGIDKLHEQGKKLKQRLRAGLAAIPGVRVLSPEAPDGVALVTIIADGIDVPTLASRLDREHGVLTRPGLHCAPEAHRLLGTHETGAVRFSMGWATTTEDVDHAIDAVAQITAPKVISLQSTS
ncbi:MAG TPA: aminotransferase class V-fold PLP-dependent enzyme [Longimicrobiales bacterium]|nr:aminotransferase class V-fold PLP-dependent enzyme [Longimicrobiales bacterium]